MGVCKSCMKKKSKLIHSSTLNFTSPNTLRTHSSRDTLFKQHSVGACRKRQVIDSRSSICPNPECINGLFRPGAPSTEEESELLSVLESHFILKYLDRQVHAAILAEMKQYEFAPREKIINQNDPGYNFFILSRGKLEVILDGIRSNSINPYNCFGDLALIDDLPRSATVQTVTRSAVWVLDRESFKHAVRTANSITLEDNKQFLVNFFQDCNEELVHLFNVQKWERGDLIIREGDRGNLMYIVKEGTVICSAKGKEIRKMQSGEMFGEMNCLSSNLRSASVTAADSVIVLSISFENLQQFLGPNLEKFLYKNLLRISVENTSLFSSLTCPQIEEIVNSVNILTFQHNELVEINNENIWVLLKGKLKAPKPIKELEFFNKSIDMIYAKTEVKIGTVPRSTVEMIIGRPLIPLQKMIKPLSENPLFKTLPLCKLIEIAQCIEKAKYTQNEIIFAEGTVGDTLYIIKTGTVNIYKNNRMLRTLTENSIFGERAILLAEKRSASAIASSEAVTCWKITKQSFESVIDTEIKQRLYKRMSLQDDSIELKDLESVGALGSGMTGTVTLCKFQDSQYALKAIDMANYTYIKSEISILLQLDHPMIMALVKTFQEKRTAYLLMEYVNGCDLFDALRQMKLASEKTAKFYTSCLLLILEHLHERKIAHRDLKPENVMIDDEGYPKIIDFGAACVVKGRTYTSIGTPHYMAPEIIKGSGYGLPVDVWSLAVMIFECLFGTLPFGSEHNDPILVYKSILKLKLRFPLNLGQKLAKARQFIESALVHEKRPTVERLKTHVWLAGTDWEALVSKRVKPEYFPKNKK